MALPRMTAEAALGRPAEDYGFGIFQPAPTTGGAVTPQVCVNSPCLRLPSGRFCITLPIIGRRCVTIPSFGTWRLRCCTRFGIPPVSCGLARC